jgi:hypothetical protein
MAANDTNLIVQAIYSLKGAGGSSNMVYPGAGVPNSNGVGWLTSYTVGANANNLVQLDANATYGSILGILPAVYKTANADSPLTVDQCKKTLVNNYGMTDADCAINLPTAVSGLSFIVILSAVRARYFKFRAGANDKIYLSGTAGSDNGYVGVASGYATATSAQFFTFKASDGGYDWFCLPIFGNWVAS